MTISISGKVFSDRGSAATGPGRHVNVSVNGAASAGEATTAADGTYALSGIAAAAGAVLTLYLQGDGENAVTVTKSTGSDVAGVDLYRDHLIVRSDNGAPLTFLDLNVADNSGASGISAIYSAASNVKAATAQGKHLLIMPGHTFSPGAGTTLNVGGDWVNRGTFVPGNVAGVVFDGAGSYSIESGGSPFTTVAVNRAACAYALADPLTASTVLLAAGTLDASPSDHPITCKTNWLNLGGAFAPRSGVVTLDGPSHLIRGSTTFYDLVSVAPCVIAFTDGTTTAASNSLTIKNATLKGSGTAGWSLAVPAAQTIDHVSVSHSTALGNAALAGPDSTDGGHNVNWVF